MLSGQNIAENATDHDHNDNDKQQVSGIEGEDSSDSND